MKDLIKDESSKGLGVLSILDRATLFTLSLVLSREYTMPESS